MISLSTWANALSYQTFALSAPAELVFVWAFGLRQAENRKLWRRDLPSAPWRFHSAHYQRGACDHLRRGASAFRCAQPLSHGTLRCPVVPCGTGVDDGDPARLLPGLGARRWEGASPLEEKSLVIEAYNYNM